MLVCGPGCSQGAGVGGPLRLRGAGGGVRAEIASLFGARQALKVRAKAPPELCTGLELHPQPLDPRHPGRGEPGQRDEADPAGGSGWEGLRSFCRAPLVPRMEARGCWGSGFLSGLLEL